MQDGNDFDPPVGKAETLAPGLRRIVAPNPSPMTFRGTNTYIVGNTELAVIDPGPDHCEHLQAILSAVTADQRISHIIVTHSHLDHSPLARALSRDTGAPVYAFGDALAGRSAAMQSLAATGLAGGGEGIDTQFAPDIHVSDGAVISGPDWRLDVIHTPGHLGNHICLGWNDICFTADHVMGWASSLVSPPDGDLTDFMNSCIRLQDEDWRVFYPGHGAPINAPQERLAWLIAHRKGREEAILASLAQGAAHAEALAQAIYVDTAPALLPAATRNVLAHLIDLTQKSHIAPVGSLRADAIFQLI